MLNEGLFPVLEFDSNRQAKIEPFNLIKKEQVPKACVITFFKEVIRQKLENDELKQIGTLHSEMLDIPIYEIQCGDYSLGLVCGFVGAAGAAGLLEELNCNRIRKVYRLWRRRRTTKRYSSRSLGCAMFRR